MQYILHDCTLPVCMIYAHKNTICTLSSLTYVQLCIFTHNAHMNTRASIMWCQIIEKATTWEGTIILSLLLCLLTTLQSYSYLHCIVCMCRGMGVCKLVHHHISNTKRTLSQLPAYRHARQLYRSSVLQYARG